MRPTATGGFSPSHVAGFKTWLKLGRCVGKAERGIAILAPIRLKNRDDDGGEQNEERLLFRTVFVWDTLSRDRWRRAQGFVGSGSALPGP